MVVCFELSDPSFLNSEFIILNSQSLISRHSPLFSCYCFLVRVVQNLGTWYMILCLINVSSTLGESNFLLLTSHFIPFSHSLLKLSTGFINAVLIDWKLTVSIAISKATNPAVTKYPQ